MNNRSILLTFLFIGVVEIFTLMSLISLYISDINVVTQSPFFLYNNIVYIISLTAILTIIVSLIYKGALLRSLILVIVLWFLALDAPYFIYIDSLPLYNDQLGFVAETLNGLLIGHIKPIQGELSSLGHAYFTTIFAVISGLRSVVGVVAIQFMLPILYIISLLSLIHRSIRDLIIALLVVLGALINPILYGRTSFAWIYLILFIVFLHNRIKEDLANKHTISMNNFITLLLIYSSYLISDPTSLIIPIILAISAVFDRRFLIPSIVSSITWFAINLIMYISGSLISLILQLTALIEVPTNPVPPLIEPSVNPVMKLYFYLRELVVFLGFLVGFLVSLAYIHSSLKIKKGVLSNDAYLWIAFYYLFTILQISALMMNRWGMVPYTIYAITVLPIVILMYAHNRWFNIFLVIIGVFLIILTPIVKWGFSSIAFPTIHDVFEASFLATHISHGTYICVSGSHLLLWFYYWLHDINGPIRYLSPIIVPSEISVCDYVSIFYRSMNIYRLDITVDQLVAEIKYLDSHFSVIYKDGFWGLWLR